ncbi:MAG: 3'(2'),5'-bisphosphate nucleotidase CysQ [Longimicrobiales bacterium]
MSRTEDLQRIAEGLEAAREAVLPFTPGSVDWEDKGGGDPVTEADRAIDDVLKAILPRAGEGWLSEETVDDRSRLDAYRVWVVDPLDGTREFVQGIPEWCISVGLVEGGKPVAGGVLNPATNELVLGSLETGVTLSGGPAEVTARDGLGGAVVLASRSEIKRGEWDMFGDAPFQVRACGSVAYKMAAVAAGLADATWTLVPKNEWDVAAGVALVHAAGGQVCHADGSTRVFNSPDPLMPNLLAANSSIIAEFRRDWIPTGVL